jgi:hypothetical protein
MIATSVVRGGVTRASPATQPRPPEEVDENDSDTLFPPSKVAAFLSPLVDMTFGVERQALPCEGNRIGSYRAHRPDPSARKDLQL